MNTKSGRSQKIHHNYARIYILTAVLCVIAAAVVGLTALHIMDSGSPSAPETTGTPANTADGTADETPTAKTETPTDPTSETPTPTRPSLIEFVPLSAADFEKPSPLTVVSEEHPFSGSLAGLINCYESRNKSAASQIKFIGSAVMMRPDAFAAFEQLHFAVNGEYDLLSLFIACGQTYDPGETKCTSKTLDSPCMTDDHATGYAADCWFLTPDKSDPSKTVSLHFYDASAAVYTKFLLDHAADLGIIQSKCNVQGHTQNDLRHLRYVGVPHARYIYENGMTLDAYIELVRGFNVNKRMKIDAPDASYEIYFVPLAESGDTSVPVPTGSDYTIWSDNENGYIVTLKTAKTA